MFAWLHPNKLSSSVSMVISISCGKYEISILHLIDIYASPKICGSSSMAYDIVFDVDLLGKFQFKLYCHIWKLMVLAIWQKKIAIFHIHFLLDSGQQVAHVALVGSCKIDVGGLNCSFS